MEPRDFSSNWSDLSWEVENISSLEDTYNRGQMITLDDFPYEGCNHIFGRGVLQNSGKNIHFKCVKCGDVDVIDTQTITETTSPIEGLSSSIPKEEEWILPHTD